MWDQLLCCGVGFCRTSIYARATLDEGRNNSSAASCYLPLALPPFIFHDTLCLTVVVHLCRRALSKHPNACLIRICEVWPCLTAFRCHLDVIDLISLSLLSATSRCRHPLDTWHGVHHTVIGIADSCFFWSVLSITSSLCRNCILIISPLRRNSVSTMTASVFNFTARLSPSYRDHVIRTPLQRHHHVIRTPLTGQPGCIHVYNYCSTQRLAQFQEQWG